MSFGKSFHTFALFSQTAVQFLSAREGKYLLSVELVELGLLAVTSPKAQNLGLGTIGHVDELLVPPALVHCADVTAQHDAVITHLQEHDRQREAITQCLGTDSHTVTQSLYPP